MGHDLPGLHDSAGRTGAGGLPSSVADPRRPTPPTPSLYNELAVRPVINAAATLTRLGGSRMPPEVVAEMAAAARAFVDLTELEARVSARAAALTHNEAAYVSSGAAAGIVVAVAACIAGTDPALIADFPALTLAARTEVVVHRGQRNGYDYAARQTGARMVEADADAAALAAAISDRTACVLWFAGAHYAPGGPPLAEVVATAHARGVPVLVDAAAQIPPVASLWHFTRDAGADLAIFSGGKGLRGPQSSGLVLGRADLIAGCRANGNPNHSIGRPMKVGKEEMVGLLAALEWTLAQDEAALLARYETIVAGWTEGLSGIAGVTAERGYPSEAGQPHGRAILRFAPPCAWTADALAAALMDRNPRIAVGRGGVAEGPGTIALNPQTLEPGEESVVLAALRDLLLTAPA
ncbi:MAG: L-seryl-tRNA(Sec) selenium transferase-related protein [uncultured Thermomicrobiales bacterium]|uniref:L-seryl-tRNA(Sec) selenium transferase-related protein n=1 Tax=uncultured Thermomicrobiales bacterium TaxID=1645740 RepID=A0A6J4VLC1_9BACT|nr:MAG: L-seryl-tRNA(Sec) selenium transferase-related protein [uncultured Thermomicrobiales bacterium]